MTDHGSAPTLRVRINHGRTLKEGWHYDSTVELTAPLGMDGEEREGLLAEWLTRARRLGEEERDARNAADRKDAHDG